MNCKKCGTANNQDAIFCEACGEKLQIQNQKPTSSSQNKINVLLCVILTIMAIIIVAMTSVFVLVLNSSNNNIEPTPTVSTQTPEPTYTSSPEPSNPPEKENDEEENITKVIIVTETPKSQPHVQPPAPPQDVVVSTMYVVNCDNWISLRSQPSTSASRITTIPLGSNVGYIAPANNGFYKINYNGQTGYALASYLSYEKPQYYSNNYYYDTMRVVNCKEWISLRSQPSTSASRITTIPLGAAVEYIAQADNGFYLVRYNGYEGYALASYLTRY